MEYIATLGPACADSETLCAMLREGMTALRLNLSHGGPDAHPEWLEAFSRAKQTVGRDCALLLDLRGAELRCGSRSPLTLAAEALVSQEELALPPTVCAALRPGMELSLDDGKLLLRADSRGLFRVVRGGTLAPRKSVALRGVELALPPLSEEDRANLCGASARGVTGVMLPFTRSAQDITRAREGLREIGESDLSVIAKIEDVQGVKAIDLIANEADAVCIARGDLGNRILLWELPAVQHALSAACLRAGTPFYVATELLSSLERQPVPTRAEMNDIFHCVLAGAAGLFLTGETALGRDPAGAVGYLRRAAEAALCAMKEEC